MAAPRPIRVDIGVFAHNEAAGIGALIAGLARQDVFRATGIAARLVVLANGCRDATVPLARAALAAVPGGPHAVLDLAEPGKSRTWTAFVHRDSRPDADLLVFCDADIDLPDPAHLRRLVEGLHGRPGLAVLNSRPVKDIDHAPRRLGLTERLIALGGGTLDDWRTAICGQLYAMPAAAARAYHLPAGLPVEDGFLRAMVLTDALTGPEAFARIDGLDGGHHVYPSERTVAGLVRHQTRIVVGGAVNAALFAHLRALPQGDRHAALADAAADPGFVARVLRARLPALPYGYVPGVFLWKRAAGLIAAPRRLLRPRGIAVLVLGLGFDAVVWVLAQVRLARGQGAGYW